MCAPKPWKPSKKNAKKAARIWNSFLTNSFWAVKTAKRGQYSDALCVCLFYNPRNLLFNLVWEACTKINTNAKRKQRKKNRQWIKSKSEAKPNPNPNPNRHQNKVKMAESTTTSPSVTSEDGQIHGYNNSDVSNCREQRLSSLSSLRENGTYANARASVWVCSFSSTANWAAFDVPHVQPGPLPTAQ